MDKVSLMALKGLDSLIPFLHDKQMGNAQFVKDEVHHFDIVSVGLTMVIAELVRGKLPVADDNKRTFISVFPDQLGLGR